jgi:hypothetical protein
MAKTFNLIARRRPTDSWTAWCSTNDEHTVKYNIKVIESYGWQWSLETPMPSKVFRELAFAQDIDPKKVLLFMMGRTSFILEDLEKLKEGTV